MSPQSCVTWMGKLPFKYTTQWYNILTNGQEVSLLPLGYHPFPLVFFRQFLKTATNCSWENTWRKRCSWIISLAVMWEWDYREQDINVVFLVVVGKYVNNGQWIPTILGMWTAITATWFRFVLEWSASSVSLNFDRTVVEHIITTCISHVLHKLQLRQALERHQAAFSCDEYLS